MNENLNLVEILKDCPKGTKLYSLMWGEVEFERVNNDRAYPIVVKTKTKQSNRKNLATFTSSGMWRNEYNGECMLFPSKDQRDWSKFKPKQPKKQPKFDPKTMQPFDKVLVRDSDGGVWAISFFSHIRGNENSIYKYATVGSVYEYCIPYNDDTKHLVGTNDDAPEFYRYWED